MTQPYLFNNKIARSSSKKVEANTFAPIMLKRKRLPEGSHNRYRIYRAPNDFITVEAATAKEAIEAGNVKDPWRIVRERVALGDVVDDSWLVLEKTEAESQSAAAPEAAEAPTPTEEATPPVVDSPPAEEAQP